MRSLIILFLFSIVLLNSCKKKDSPNNFPPELSLPDSTFKVQSVTIAEVNEAEITCQVSPPKNESFESVYLLWSQSHAFSSAADSVILGQNILATSSFVKKITGLKQMTDYYAKIKVVFKGKSFFSEIKQFKTDSLRIEHAFGLDSFPVQVNRDQLYFVFTNLSGAKPNTSGVPTKIFIGKYECALNEDDGNIILFKVPVSVPPGRYSLRLERGGLVSTTPDSIYILKGLWSYLPSPVTPFDPGYGNDNGIGYYGTCQSATKGYLIPGRYFHDTYYLDVGNPDYYRPGFVWEFDGATSEWTIKRATNPKYFENPVCYYYNNGIYVIAGLETDMYNGNNHNIHDMYRLDLSTMTWSTVGHIPIPTTYGPVSFELNNEWYLGLGQDSANVSVCCGVPLPSKKFWKYNPATNKWSQIADFPGTKFQERPTGFQLGGKGYIFFGGLHKGDFDAYNDVKFDREFWSYDPQADSWTQLALPSNGGPPEGEKYCIVTYNGKAYFLTAQKRELFSYYYGTDEVLGCLEYDPATGDFKRISNPNPIEVMQKIYQNGNTVILQADALGYTESIPNTTHKLVLE
ncbi:MAG: hypothetical protein ACTHNG_16615 [Ginsengibacter sp.]